MKKLLLLSMLFGILATLLAVNSIETPENETNISSDTSGIRILTNETNYGSQGISYETQSAENLTTGLLAYWSLNDLNDSSEYNYTLVDYGATPTASGKVNGAYLFDGSDDYLLPTLSLDLDSGHSVSFWANMTVLDNLNAIFSSTWGSSAQYWMIMNRDDKNGWTIQSNNAQAAAFVSAGLGETLDVWQHVVMTIDSSGFVIWYVNGIPQGNGTLPYTTGTGPVKIGDYWGGGSPFDGTIDELGVWNRVLSQEEVEELYNSGEGLNPFFSLPLSQEEAKPIIEDVFNASLSNVKIEYNQSLYIEYQNETSFDFIADYYISYGNKRYVLNYGNESYSNIEGIRTTLNILQLTPALEGDLRSQIESFINVSLN